MPDLVRQLPPYISTRWSARLLALLFLAIVVVGWVAVGFGIAEIRRIGAVAEGVEISPNLREAYYTVNVVLFAAQAVLLLGAAFGFVAWLFRARVNVRALGMRSFDYGREWTVLGFLIPLLNLWRPYRVVSEVWRASDPRTLDPFEWKGLEGSTLVRLWWVSFVAYALVEIFAVGMGSSAGLTPSRLQLAQAIELVADAAGAVSAALALFVVLRISHNQEQKWALLQQHEQPADA